MPDKKSPGPWKVEGPTQAAVCPIRGPVEGSADWLIVDAHGHPVAFAIRMGGWAEADANSGLIAAAPDLLYWLEEVARVATLPPDRAALALTRLLPHLRRVIASAASSIRKPVERQEG